MNNYTVIWRIELEASSPEAAAQMARDIQQDPTNIATVFEIFKGNVITVDTSKT